MLEKMIIDTAEKLRLVSQSMPKVWDGRESILEMRDTGFEYWRQEEWIEFYFKFLCQKHFHNIIDTPGKKYGNTEFDAFREISWDFKVDSVDPGTYSVTANDAEAIANTINDYGYYGMILAIGEVVYGEEISFKKWYDDLRGEVGKYETNKINAGIMSRTRKTGFVLKGIYFICFDNETLHLCGGLLQDYSGKTESNILNPKDVIIDIGEIPNTAFVTSEGF
ncbi:hypothetical protein F4054_04580 [Candidatus Poribacteria bacterium]|nr:hypothetical protein [Candidatus Poribacteria bacterium]MYK21519.1 hypothetical protein [Candidatus Poribacteria bacterium]